MNEGYFSEGKCINKKMRLFSHLFYSFLLVGSTLKTHPTVKNSKKVGGKGQIVFLKKIYPC